MSAVDVAVLALGLLLGGAVGAVGYAVLRPNRGGEVRLTITRGALPPAVPSEPSPGAPELDPPFAVANRPPDAAPAPQGPPRDAIPVTRGRDPTFARLVDSAERSGAAVLATSATPVAVGAAVGTSAPPWVIQPVASGAVVAATPAGRGAAAPATAMLDTAEQGTASGERAPEARAGGSAGEEDDAGPAAPAGDTSADGTGETASGLDLDGPCAPERRLAAERCTLAARLRDAHRAVTAEARELKRGYEEAANRAEAARRSIDGRAVLESKTEAQRRFRQARLAATSPADMEAAARIWLEEIDRINRAVRQGRATLAAEQERGARLLTALEEMSTRVDAARIASESAEERCRQAREALAGCEEATSSRLAAHLGVPHPAAPPVASGGPAPPWVEGATAGTETGSAERDSSLPEPLILRIARGDAAALERVVQALAAGSAEQEQRWRFALDELIAAVRAAAIDAGALEFPTDHPFWGNFTQAECRDVATALASLGYRFDGAGGFAEEHFPSQRDLSLAVGYAGLDPLRIRRWPGEAGMRELYREVAVAADRFLADSAADLTLSELIEALGRRAEPLTDLWNAWGRVRPFLLAAG